MGYQHVAEGQLDYSLCHYGQSKLRFRGPRQEIKKNHVAFLGGTETFGKFVAAPFPDMVGEVVGRPTVNLGCVNAGLDTFLADETVFEICNQSSACVLQVMGAHMLSNRLYSVHPRRNDRFLSASSELRALFKGVDFAEIHFARHLISVLAHESPRRLEVVREELAAVWEERMTAFVEKIEVPVVLLWISARTPESEHSDPFGDDPLFVNRAMLDAVRPKVAGLVEVLNGAPRTNHLLDQTHATENDIAAARELPGQGAHFRIAAAVSDVLKRVS